eukprot:13335607-Alexandrium_andersonii.AAC.1
MVDTMDEVVNVASGPRVQRRHYCRACHVLMPSVNALRRYPLERPRNGWYREAAVYPWCATQYFSSCCHPVTRR